MTAKAKDGSWGCIEINRDEMWIERSAYVLRSAGDRISENKKKKHFWDPWLALRHFLIEDTKSAA